MAKFICKFPDKTYILKGSRRTIIDSNVVFQPGKSVQFQNGELITEDQEVIDKLKGNMDFGVTLFEEKVEETKKKKADTAE